MPMNGTISIIVNGEDQQAAQDISVAEMLKSLNIHGGRVAIERNMEILPRAAWNDTKVLAGDRYEIVQFVGGG
jgi:sulfur carrier protein